MVECHIGRRVMAKIQETTVCTETAMGIMSTAIMAMARSSRRRCSAPPCQPRASSLYRRRRQPGVSVGRLSRKIAMSGISGR